MDFLEDSQILYFLAFLTLVLKRDVFCAALRLAKEADTTFNSQKAIWKGLGLTRNDAMYTTTLSQFCGKSELQLVGGKGQAL